jgi:hypothetical protein
MSESWGGRRVEESPQWSTLTADSTPLELSVVLGAEPVALRASVEAQAVPASPAAYWRSAQRLTSQLAEVYDMDPARLRQVEHLFAPHSSQRPPMVAFHTMGWSPRHRPEGKIHLWAGGSGPSAGGPICEQALATLGFPDAWRHIAQTMHPDDVVSYLCLDIDSGPTARTKLYVQHRGHVSEERLARWDRLGPNPHSGDGPTMAEIANRARARSAWRSDVPTRTRLQWRSNSRRFWSCGTYVSLVPDRVSPIQSVMHQFALPPHVRSDAEARRMIREVMDVYGVGDRSRLAYERCAEFFAGDNMAEQMYAHTFVSAQRSGSGPPRVATYFNPRMYYRRHGLTNGDLSRARQFHEGVRDGAAAPNRHTEGVR